jgi:hypothetical protein
LDGGLSDAPILKKTYGLMVTFLHQKTSRTDYLPGKKVPFLYPSGNLGLVNGYCFLVIWVLLWCRESTLTPALSRAAGERAN